MVLDRLDTLVEEMKKSDELILHLTRRVIDERGSDTGISLKDMWKNLLKLSDIRSRVLEAVCSMGPHLMDTLDPLDSDILKTLSQYSDVDKREFLEVLRGKNEKQ